jgi:glycosyltransferase involved in cell wall biosynthesis
MKVLFVNNYPMDKAWEEWKRGEYPGNHLWGATLLQKYGIEVDILPHEKYIFLNKIGWRLKLGGYLDQQIRILLRLFHYDLIYSACEDNTFFLALLRSLGIFWKPVVVILHHPLEQSRRNRIFVKGLDKILCLSKSIKEQIEDKFDISEGKVELLEWAIEVPFYESEVENVGCQPEFILSAGKTQRDYTTLVKAFSGINYPLHIYCTGESAPETSAITPNIIVQYNHQEYVSTLSYQQLLAEYKKAYAVAIPLAIAPEHYDSVGPSGLTSLLEAMVMRKAVVMTRNRQINIDIEKEGIGIWVDPGDISGWQEAMSYLLAHPEKSREMGNRGYYLCKDKYNLEIFAANLARIFKDSLNN